MKRLQHYDKELGVIMSVFGSSESSAMHQYLQLFDEAKQILPADSEIKMAISSKTVLTNLEKQGNYYHTLAEQLAYIDRMGYKKVVVSSVNLFPTEEHESLLRIINAFGQINSKTEYEVTMPLFTRAKQTNNYLVFLNAKLRAEYNISNIVYVAHGARNLNTSGNQTYTYVRDYLKLLNSRNYFYTIEGSFSYNKDLVLREIESENKISAEFKEILIVPLLLGIGNHNKNDIREIKNELSEVYDIVKVPENFMSEGDFSLLKINETRNYFIDEIKNAIERIL